MAHAEGPQDANDAVNRLLEPRNDTAGPDTGLSMTAAPAITRTDTKTQDHAKRDEARQKPVLITDWASI